MSIFIGWDFAKIRLTAISVTILVGAISLTGCSSNSAVTQAAAPGSPDLTESGQIFAELPLLGEPLTVFTADETTQLRGQVSRAGADIAGVKVDPGECQEFVVGSFDLPNLYWSSLVAQSDNRQVAGQLFLAPNEEAAAETLGDIRELARGCESMTVDYDGVSTSAVLEVYLDTGQSVGFSQTIIREGVESRLTVQYSVLHNTLLAVAGAKQNVGNPEAQLREYTDDFFERLLPLYLELGKKKQTDVSSSTTTDSTETAAPSATFNTDTVPGAVPATNLPTTAVKPTSAPHQGNPAGQPLLPADGNAAERPLRP